MRLIDRTLTIHPFLWLRNTAVAGLVGGMFFFPHSLSSAADVVPPRPPPPMTAAQVHRIGQIRMVEGELADKMTKVEDDELHRVSETIVDEATLARIDPLFVLAVIEAESKFDIEAVSPTGARGLMQIIPSTFRLVSTSKRMFDPVENVRAGIRYLARLRDTGFRRPETVLLAWNQGPAVALAVYRDGSETPEEGASFVPVVMTKYRRLLLKNGQNPRDAQRLFAASAVEQRSTRRSVVRKEITRVSPEDHPVPSPIVAEAMPGGGVPSF